MHSALHPPPLRASVLPIAPPLAFACTEPPPPPEEAPAPQPEATSLLGEQLFAKDDTLGEIAAADAALAEQLRTDDPALQDYYCFVLLDFVTADRELDDLPLAAALALSERLGLRDRFAALVQQELRLRKKQFEKIDQEKERRLEEAGRRAVMHDE